MLHDMINWVVETVGAWGYPGIVIMMALESSFVPFPSEVVMIPAGLLAYQGKLNMWWAIVWGVVGSWIGALVNYYMAVYLGRPFLLRWGKYFFVKEKDFLKVEDFFRRHGEIGTFTGRLVPLVRQYISFPAGLARMALGKFLFFTGLGAGIWVTILALIGRAAGPVLVSRDGQPPKLEDLLNNPAVKEHAHEATVGLLVGCAVLVVGYIWWHRRNKATGAG